MPNLVNGLGGTDGFGVNVLAQGSTASATVNLGFTLNFFGTTYTQLFINTDGTVTFGAAESYRIDAVTGNTGHAIIAPFSFNSDTSRGTGISIGGTSTGADKVFYALFPTELVVTWDDVVGSNNSPPGNAFQLIIVKDGPNAGDFDFEFNYESIFQSGSFDPNSATDTTHHASQAGYGQGDGTHSTLLPDSSSITANFNLPSDSNTGIAGTYDFYVRSNVVQAAPSFSILALTPILAEGNSGPTAYTFQVTRSGYAGLAADVAWTVVNGTTDANDFAGGTLPSGTVSFAAGEIVKFITVNVNGDTTAEANESFSVNLTGTTVVGGLSNTAAITTAGAGAAIQNDDTSIRIDGANFSNKEGNSGTTALTFTVTRSGILTGASSATWTVSGSNSTPASANDFVGNAFPTGTVSFAAGENSKTITVNVQGDTTYEPDETFNVTLSNPTGATISNAVAGGTIQNDDSQISIGDPGSFHYFEGNSGQTVNIQYTVNRAGDTSQSQSVTWTVTPGSSNPVNGADFVGGTLPTGVVNFAVGQTTATITIPVQGDNTIEPDENFLVTLSNPTNGANIGTAGNTGTIVSDDTGLAIAAPGNNSPHEGNSGTVAITYTVTRSGYLSNVYPGSGPTTVNWAVTGDGANPANANDFAGGVLPSGMLSFAAGETTKTITVNIQGDTMVEPNEHFTVTLFGAKGDASNTIITQATAGGAIVNDDTKIARNDFNGDGKSDILWQTSDGTGAVWLLNGTTLSGGNTIGNPGSVTWKAIGSGDFDGDGKADILWQNTDGSAAVWLMNGSTLAGGGVPGNPGPAWTALGAADFNGDGKSDILWRDGSGNIAIWLMNGATLTGGAVAGNPGNGWSYKGYGDFNGDGKTDLVFQNTDGSIAIWLMNGAIVTGGGPVGNPGSNWSVRAVGDFDGDGKSDLLLQDTSGAAVVWEMNGTTVSGGGPVGNPGTAWTVKMAEDVDGDGKADILWQAGDGSPAVWLMNGTNVTGGGIVGSNPGSNWHIVTG